MKTKTLSLLLISLVLTCFALPQRARALSPAPDGGYPGGNTAEGQAALLSLTTGGYNTAVGFFSLRSDTTGSFNTALGAGALFANSAPENTAVGAGALLSNTGIGNTATGAFALVRSTGNSNTATGDRALESNTTGTSNTAIGQAALYQNDTGSSNIAFGVQALGNNTSGSNNVGLGNVAGSGVSTASNVTCIGNVGGANVNNTTWVGGIWNVNPQSGTTAPVVVSDGGQLGIPVSSQRFKKDIAGMDKTSEAILSLRPVKFHYKTDAKGTPQFGLIAEEVAKVDPALVLPDKEGKPYSVRYDAVNAMLLNEFLKEHRIMREQSAMIARQQKQIEALTSGLQKVSAQLELSKSAPQTVVNNQ